MISNYNLLLLVVTQEMHWEELHIHGAVERALKAERLVTTESWIPALVTEF